MPNIYDTPAIPTTGETFEELLRTKNVRIERIISSDSPDQKEYDQDEDELVLLLRGSATLLVEDEEIGFSEGDYLYIPAHTKHKVLRTEKGTVWLGVFVDG